MNVNGFYVSPVFLPHVSPVKCFTCGQRIGHIADIFSMVHYMFSKMLTEPSKYLEDYQNSELYKHVIEHIRHFGNKLWTEDTLTTNLQQLETLIDQIVEQYSGGEIKTDSNSDEQHDYSSNEIIKLMFRWFKIHRLCCKRMLSCQYNPNIEYLIYNI